MTIQEGSNQPDREEQRVSKALQALANEEVSPEHFARTMASVRIKSKRMEPMRKLVRSSIWAGGLATAVVMAMILIPATYTVKVGSLVKAEFTVPVGQSVNEIVKATPAFANARKMVMVDDGKATLTIACQEVDAEGVGEKLETELVAKFPELTDLKVSTEPIVEHRGGNALAAATGGRIEIGCEGMTDGEIEAAITQALTGRGLKVQQVTVSTTEPAEGQIERRVNIWAEGDEGAKLPDLELQLEVGAGDGQQEKVIIRDKR